jgi:hypothetical protein
MSERVIGFSGGQTIIDKVIQKVSGAEAEDVTHAFTFVNGRPFEAMGTWSDNKPYPGAWFRPKDKYVGVPEVKYIKVDIPDAEAYDELAYTELEGRLYGIIDCASTAIKILTGKNMLEDGMKTVMCAETITLMCRAGGLNVCSDLAPDQVAPIVLYRDLLNNFGGIDITEEFIKKGDI